MLNFSDLGHLSSIGASFGINLEFQQLQTKNLLN